MAGIHVEGAEMVVPGDWRPAHAPIIGACTRSEECWGIAERIRDGRRFQIIAVIRNEAIAEVWVELPFTQAREFDIFCGLEHSVAEAMDWAASMREDKHWDEVIAEKSANSTLFRDFFNQVENDRLIARNRTTIGPDGNGKSGMLQRNGFVRKSRQKRVYTGIDVPSGETAT